MPTIPRILIRDQLPEVSLPHTNKEAFGAGAFETGAQALEKASKELREQRNPIEAAQLRSEYDIGIDKIRNEMPADIEPEEWPKQYAEQEKQLRADIVGRTKERDVLNNVQTHIIGQNAQATKAVTVDALKRRADLNRAGLDDQLDLLSNQIAVTGDPAEREQKAKEGKALIESQSVGRHPALSYEQKVNARQAFEAKIAERVIDFDARKDPIGFAEKVEAGDYAGTANSVQVQRGLDIAEKLKNGRDVRQAKADKGRGEAARRAFWSSAETHTMDEEQLDRAAVWYDIPKDTVDKMKRMNLGLKEGTPYGEKLIVDALEPVNKVVPTVGDVRAAERNLRNLGDKVSTDSAEYRQATSRLRSMYDSLTPSPRQPENVERQQRSDGRRRLGQLMMQYDLRSEPELRGQLLGQIETMPGNKVDSFLNEKEKEWKSRQDKGAEALKGIRGLRSLAK